MYMTQAEFARYIGVSRRAVTYMKQQKQLVFNNKKVDVKKSIELLKSIGKTFDSTGKLITSNNTPAPAPTNEEKHLLNTEFKYPTLSSGDSTQQSLILEDLGKEIEELKEEAEKEGLTLDKVLTKEIDSLEPIEVSKIKVFWQGQIEKVKYEKEIGKLVDKQSVYDEQFAIARTIRDAIMSMSNRVAHKLIGKKELHEIKQIIDNEALKILENLSR